MNNPKPSFEIIWLRIKSLEGEKFETVSRKPFTYEIEGNIFHSSSTQYNIMKSDFARVLMLVPLDGPGTISNDVRGSAYIWGVLHDSRIRQNDW